MLAQALITCSLKVWSAVGSLIHSQIDSSVQKAHEKIDVEMNKY
jgi:hypothetical protein